MPGDGSGVDFSHPGHRGKPETIPATPLVGHLGERQKKKPPEGGLIDFLFTNRKGW
ncbi:hypothetical protein DLREEDagrD3_06640 [Denitratisoma sp. agr-D3]